MPVGVSTHSAPRSTGMPLLVAGMVGQFPITQLPVLQAGNHLCWLSYLFVYKRAGPVSAAVLHKITPKKAPECRSAEVEGPSGVGRALSWILL